MSVLVVPNHILNSQARVAIDSLVADRGYELTSSVDDAKISDLTRCWVGSQSLKTMVDAAKNMFKAGPVLVQNDGGYINVSHFSILGDSILCLATGIKYRANGTKDYIDLFDLKDHLNKIRTQSRFLRGDGCRQHALITNEPEKT